MPPTTAPRGEPAMIPPSGRGRSELVGAFRFKRLGSVLDGSSQPVARLADSADCAYLGLVSREVHIPAGPERTFAEPIDGLRYVRHLLARRKHALDRGECSVLFGEPRGGGVEEVDGQA